MAGDWIKMRKALQTHPKVVRIASALQADTLRVVGALHAIWSMFDEHSNDGLLEGYTPDFIDQEIGWPGFTKALAAVRWVSIDAEALVLPEFDTHNGTSAKRRAQDADRKKTVRNLSAPQADKKRTREEKRREENKSTPIPPSGVTSDLAGDLPAEPASASRKMTYAQFVQACKDDSEKLIPPDHEVFEFAEAAGIPKDYLELAWREFAHQYRPTKKTQVGKRGWRQKFSNCVRRNWFKLWWFPSDGQCELTTAGVQLRRERDAA